jgi:hypothetical protein
MLVVTWSLAKYGVLTNFDALDSLDRELGQNPTFEKVCLTALPTSMSALAMIYSLTTRGRSQYGSPGL